MIPKIIHYCWFGGNPKPKLAKKCIKSWKKYCPDYEIIEWNENNFDISSAPLYVRQAYEAKKWAFVTDYVRLRIVYENGGIYLDTDVELIKSPNSLLNYNAYFGFEESMYVATGLGFGAVKNSSIIKSLMDDYEKMIFINKDGSFNTTPCPVINASLFESKGIVRENMLQVIDDNIIILPTEYLSPLSYKNTDIAITDNTISIHWFLGSWLPPDQQGQVELFKKGLRKKKFSYIIDYIIHIPNRLLRYILGQKHYDKLKSTLKK